ncbi:hypothetical protein HNQ80_000178 [Anaerosolibacter carboniphilus]|uniref:Helix-turn-helix domain-containing protein n=1 Tax=Anaerosolibacter carboniphilus TaxID=1417629 RepID=A0A841KV95_9FIRM|nr:hypothetical protein [Anaerosolibacter carboniphilus]MBB6214109.1 hypothetical protein [Anaerosolibacter carboniphilus]
MNTNKAMSIMEFINLPEFRENNKKGKRKKKIKKVIIVNKNDRNFVKIPVEFLYSNNFDGNYKIQLGIIKLFQNRSIRDKKPKIHLKKVAKYINMRHLETARKVLKGIEEMKVIKVYRVEESNLYSIRYRFNDYEFGKRLRLNPIYGDIDLYDNCKFIRICRDFFYNGYFPSALLEILYYYLAYNIKRGFNRISNVQICNDLRLNEKTLQRNLKTLEEMQLIKKHTGNGRGKKTEYELIKDALIDEPRKQT